MISKVYFFQFLFVFVQLNFLFFFVFHFASVRSFPSLDLRPLLFVWFSFWLNQKTFFCFDRRTSSPCVFVSIPDFIIIIIIIFSRGVCTYLHSFHDHIFFHVDSIIGKVSRKVSDFFCRAQISRLQKTKVQMSRRRFNFIFFFVGCRLFHSPGITPDYADVRFLRIRFDLPWC